MTKVEFIRKYPNLPAADVVAKARAVGLYFGTGYVYVLRHKDKKRNGKSPRAYTRRAQPVDPLRAAVEQFAAQIREIARADMAKRLGEMVGG